MHRRVHAVMIVWALIYLPGLGSLEIKGEEGRRILPAVTMLESGDYLVPRVGSEPYFRKPPLINWMIAGAFKLTGVRNEWTARLPSALCILAVALALATLGARDLGHAGSLFASMSWLTFAGNIEKGRQIEIEALYVSLTALGFIFWIARYRRGTTGLRLWFWPAVFLGLGTLAKGPLPHLLFFYGPVVALLSCDRNLKLLATKAHFFALLIIAGIFAAWALPTFLSAESGRVATIWGRQFSGRVTGQNFQLFSWVTAIPRSFAYFLPWLVLAPLSPPEKDRRHRALLVGTLIPLIGVNLIPEAIPRFAMPALGPAAWWFGELLRHDQLHWPRWLTGAAFSARWRNRIIGGFVSLTCLVMVVYASCVQPRFASREKIRKHARQIDLLVPADVPLWAVDPQYQPYLFYVKAPVRYASTIEELPAETRFFLVQQRDEAEASSTRHWGKRQAQLVLRIKDYREREVILYAVPP